MSDNKFPGDDDRFSGEVTMSQDSAYSDYMLANQEGRSHYIGPSGVNDCYRKYAYQYLGFPNSTPVSTSAADMGTLLHLGYSALISHQYDPEVRRPDVKVHTEGMPRSGSADDVDYLHKIVTDLKSAKDRVWQSFVNQGGPYQSYWDQVQIYALGLRQQHGGDWTMRITVLNRETGEIAEFVRDADPEVGLALVAKAASRHAELMSATALLGSVDPEELIQDFPREGAGPGRGMPCDWCPFITECWPVPDPDGGRTPQSESVAHDEAEIGVYAAEYLVASAEESKAGYRKKDAQAFIKGLDGVYPAPDGGEIRITTVGGKPSQTPDCDAMKETLEGLGLEVPLKWTARASYPKVSRVKGK